MLERRGSISASATAISTVKISCADTTTAPPIRGANHLYNGIIKRKTLLINPLRDSCICKKSGSVFI